MLNFIKYHFTSRRERLTNIEKLDMSNSKKYWQTVRILNKRLIAYQKEGRLSTTEVAILCHLINVIREETIESLKVDIFTHILKGCNDAMHTIKGVHHNG